MSKSKFQARQGDVFIERIPAILATAMPVNRAGDVILARGEITSHAHWIAAASLFWMVYWESTRRCGIAEIDTTEPQNGRSTAQLACLTPRWSATGCWRGEYVRNA